MFNITVDADGYSNVIKTMLAVDFPSAKLDKCSIFEALSSQIIGTKQHRNGPIPSPEVLVSIRSVIRAAVQEQRPIPILVPFGASKQGNYSVDIAELMALKQLECLRKRVEEIFPPGLDITLRVEDATDRLLFPNQPAKIISYTHRLLTLIRIIAPSITVLQESLRVDFSNIDSYVHILYGVMAGKMRENNLTKIGWEQGLKQEQISYYTNAYEKLYPHLSQDERYALIATYFAASLMRRQQGATGDKESIVLDFNNHVPGRHNPERRVNYRTLPTKYQHSHRPPWMGKGCVMIQGNIATPRVEPWNTDLLFTVTNINVYGDNGGHVQVESDYHVMED